MRSRVVADLCGLSAAALVAGSGLIAVGVASATPTAAAGGCPSATSGVTVTVQFPTGTATGCASGNPGTALNALRSAGFSTVGSVRFFDAVVCAINNFPSSRQCVMPPASAYWAIFWADRGGSWVYSQLGVASLTLKPGQVLAFRFGTGTPPSVPVPAKPSTPKPSSALKRPSASKPASSKPTQTTKPKQTTTPQPTASRRSSAPAAPHAASTSTSSSASSSRPSSNASLSRSAGSSASTSASSTTPPRDGHRDSSATSTVRVTVTSSKTVVVDGKKKQVITFDDGSKITVAPGSDEAKKYRVGVVKDGTDVTASAPMTTSVPSPTITSHPSLSTSGSVPPMALPEATSGGSNNLPGILAGVGVLGLAGGGAAFAAMRQR